MKTLTWVWFMLTWSQASDMFWRSNWLFRCDVVEAFMSLSELELFEHTTHLGGNRPDGMNYEGVW